MGNCQWAVSMDHPSKASEESGGLHSLPYKHRLLFQSCSAYTEHQREMVF